MLEYTREEILEFLYHKFGNNHPYFNTIKIVYLRSSTVPIRSTEHLFSIEKLFENYFDDTDRSLLTEFIDYCNNKLILEEDPNTITRIESMEQRYARYESNARKRILVAGDSFDSLAQFYAKKIAKN